MESLSSQQAPDEFKEKNDDTSKIETPYTDPSVNCSSLKSVSDSQNVLSVDQRNGNLDTHNVIQSEENKTLENSENLYVTENLHTDCDSRNLYQDINCEDVNRFNSSTELETDCKVSDTDDPLYLGQESKTEDILDNEAKDEIQVLNGKVESDEKSSSTLSVGDKDYVKLLVPDVPDDNLENVNNIDESPFEDVNKCSESDTESHENSLQDPLLISDGSHSDNANNVNKDNELVISNNVDPSNLEDRLEPEGSSHDENAQENQDNELAITEALLSESQVEDFTEHDTQKELEALLAPQSNNIVEGFGEDSILIANLSVPPPIQLIREVEEVVPIEENSISTSKDIINHIAKKQRLDGEFPSLEGNEGKPSLLKILPIKNGHGLWSLEELKLILEERGSVLLRLCGAPEAGNEDIIDGPKADFTALLLDDAVPIPDVNGIIEPEDEFTTLSQHSFMDGLNDSYLNEEYTPPFWKHRIPDSRLPCVPKKKRLPPSTRSFTPKVHSTPGQYRGRKRGRPPLHNRAWIPKMKFTPPKFINEPIKFRPPTPPPALVSDGSRLSGGLLEAALTKNAPLAIGKKNIIEPLMQKEDHIASKLHYEENEKVKKSPAAFEEEDEHLSADAFTDDNDHAGKEVDATNSQGIKPKKVMIRIPCPHCPLTFRKKLALTGHMRLRHKTLKKCPICQESIKIKGKGSMQYHISKVHKDEKNFECDICHLKFTLFHHLKNHKRLIHDVIVNNSAVNSDEEDEPASPTDTLDENELPDKNDVNEEVDSVKEKVQIVKSTRTTRSGAVYETTTSLIREDKTVNKKSPNSSSKGKTDNPNKDHQSKSHSDKVDSNSTALKSEESMRTLRSRSALTVSLSGKSNSKEKESPKANEEKTKKVIKASDSDDKKSKHDETADFDDAAEEDKFANSENGNESDDEEDSESDSEIEEKKKYFCDKCEMGFSHVFKLRHHKKKKHSSVWSNSGGEGFMVKNESLTCKFCQKKCRSEHQLNDHVLQHKSSGEKAKVTVIDNGQSSSLRKPITSTRSSTESSDSQLRIDESETEDPTEGTPLKSGEIPAYIVRKGRIYFCTKCDLSFKRERQMTYHLKKIHEALYPFRKCPHCPRVFRSSGPFTRHLREHRGKRCPIDGCKAKYKVLRMIKKHQRHAHPKFPHRCTRCVALFAKESELESHTKNEHKDSSSRRNSRDEDDDDDEEEEEVEEECEEEEEEEEEEDEDEEEEEEEEKHEKDREKEEKSKVQINKNRQENSNFSKKSSNSGNNTKVIESLLEGSTTGVRRTRSANISYKEDDDDDDYEFGIDKTIPIRTNPLPVQAPTTSIAEPLQQQEELKKPSFPSHPNPLKNLREAIMMQTASKAKPHLTTTEALPPSVKPKRPYVRRAPYKKRKVDNSWTAAVKAQYQSFPSSESSDTTIVSPSPHLNTDSMSDPSPMYSSPGITADVVRRVAESLLNRHQEQQQQQQEQHQKQQQLHHNRYHNLHPHHHLPQNPQNQEKPLKPQKRPYRRRKPCNPVNPSFISYNAKSQLPRITYSSLVAASASRENSMSSMEDSSHADTSEYYGTSFSSGSGGRYFSLRHNQTRIPDDEDSGPPKVLRFDSF